MRHARSGKKLGRDPAHRKALYSNLAGALAVDVVETVVFVRWSRRRRSVVGAEALVGRTAVAVSALSPRGQVKLDGELWLASSDVVLAPGEEVLVTGVDGLLLRVEPSK